MKREQDKKFVDGSQYRYNVAQWLIKLMKREADKKLIDGAQCRYHVAQ
jgi:hypothetical protein